MSFGSYSRIVALLDSIHSLMSIWLTFEDSPQNLFEDNPYFDLKPSSQVSDPLKSVMFNSEAISCAWFSNHEPSIGKLGLALRTVLNDSNNRFSIASNL